MRRWRRPSVSGEAEVMRRLQRMLDARIIRRIAAVPNHYRLGYVANGMTVWDVDDEAALELGAGRRPARLRLPQLSQAAPSAALALQPVRHGPRQEPRGDGGEGHRHRRSARRRLPRPQPSSTPRASSRRAASGWESRCASDHAGPASRKQRHREPRGGVAIQNVFGVDCFVGFACSQRRSGFALAARSFWTTIALTPTLSHLRVPRAGEGDAACPLPSPARSVGEGGTRAAGG